MTIVAECPPALCNVTNNLSPEINFLSYLFLKESNCVYSTVNICKVSSLTVSISTLIFLHVHFTRLVSLMCILLLEQNMEGHVLALLLFIEDVERNSFTCWDFFLLLT